MIQRRWPETIGAAVAALVLLGWSAAIIKGALAWGALLAVLGFSAAVLAWLGPADATCPLCSKVSGNAWAMSGLDITECLHCRRFYSLASKQEAPHDYVSDAPYFPVPLEGGAELPKLCCHCAAPAEKVKEVVQHDAPRRSRNKVVKESVTVPVPYCGKHDENVDIQLNEKGWVLRVRSYGFYRAAVLN